MSRHISSTKRRTSKSKAKTRRRGKQSLQKPRGVIGPRVKKVGGERFAIVCVDPAKNRSEWMMADYFGNLLIQPQTVEHHRGFPAAVELIQQAREQHGIEDLIVVVERTGNYYLTPKRAFARAGLETRVLHPFVTKQYRAAANPGNKTDETDLHAQHRAAVAGFGLCEYELEPPYRALQLRARHRRNLVEKSSALACQIREHLHMALPGFGSLFDHLLGHQSAMAMARRCDSAATVLEIGHDGLARHLRENKVRFQARTIDKVLAWASQAVRNVVQDAPLHHALWTDLEALYQQFRQRISALERDLAGDLAATFYVRLMAIPGINVVSAAELAGEMGPIAHYANANAITGRSGIYPSRSQSDQTDNNRGPIIRHSNRRLRAALMRIADNLVCHCNYYRARADVDRANRIHETAIRIKVTKKFTRLVFACVAGDEPLRHPCFQKPDSILEKLRAFHHEHQTPVDRILSDLKITVEQLPGNTRSHEAEAVAAVLEKRTKCRRGAAAIGELLPAVLARLKIKPTQENENMGRP